MIWIRRRIRIIIQEETQLPKPAHTALYISLIWTIQSDFKILNEMVEAEAEREKVFALGTDFFCFLVLVLVLVAFGFGYIYRDLKGGWVFCA